jgi:S1-C subfamily serine protease
VVRGFIGVEQRELTPEIAQTLNLPIQRGVLITGVQQSGPAAAAGLRPGDVVVSVAGRAVSTPVQMRNAVAALKPRQVAAIGVQRGGESLELKVTIGQRPKLQVQREQ